MKNKNLLRCMKADIEGIIASLNISQDNFLIPVYESVINSIQSINELTIKKPDHNGRVEIIIERDKSQTELFSDGEYIGGEYPIKSITIIDNGIGFDNNNFKSFNTAHSTKKIKIGGKGLGRFAMLSVYDTVNINSLFQDQGKSFRREILFKKDYDEIEDAKCDEIKQGERIKSGTRLIMSSLNIGFLKQSTLYNQENIAENILHHCLLYYINNKQPEIIIKEEGLADINLSKVFEPSKYLINQYKQVNIKKDIFNFYLVKDSYDKGNFYSFTADNRMVEMKKTSSILPVFKSRVSRENQEFYVGIYITSKYLDTRVLPNREEIKFDKDKNDGSKNFNTITEREIELKIIDILKNEFSEIIINREIENKDKVDLYLATDGIGYRWLSNQVDEKFLQSIPDDADFKKLDDLFHDLEYKNKKALKNKKNKLLARDYSNKKEYRELLNDVLSTINKVNESQLAQYVSHRKVVIDLLDKYLGWQENQQKYEEESALHNLFFTMGGTEKTIAHSHHNLWLIDERLSFFSFIRSDIAQKNQDVIESDSTKEPDIVLYDTVCKYGDLNDSKDLQSLVFVEFKRPHRELTLSEYETQYRNQIKGIEKGILTENNSYLNALPNLPIYFYYICDVNSFNKLKHEAIQFGQFILSPYNTLINVKGNITQEIITYQQIKSGASQRNRAFFKNLGI